MNRAAIRPATLSSSRGGSISFARSTRPSAAFNWSTVRARTPSMMVNLSPSVTKVLVPIQALPSSADRATVACVWPAVKRIRAAAALDGFRARASGALTSVNANCPIRGHVATGCADGLDWASVVAWSIAQTAAEWPDSMTRRDQLASARSQIPIRRKEHATTVRTAEASTGTSCCALRSHIRGRRHSLSACGSRHRTSCAVRPRPDSCYPCAAGRNDITDLNNAHRAAAT